MSNPSQIQGQSQGGESCKPRLSPRETQILKLMAAGYRNKEIADALAIGEHTTESHNRRLFRKLGVRSRLHASHRALDLGLLTMAADDHNRPRIPTSDIDPAASPYAPELVSEEFSRDTATESPAMLELLVSSLSLVVMCGERLLRYKSLPDSVRVLTLQTIDPARLLGPAIETIR